MAQNPPSSSTYAHCGVVVIVAWSLVWWSCLILTCGGVVVVIDTRLLLLLTRGVRGVESGDRVVTHQVTSPISLFGR